MGIVCQELFEIGCFQIANPKANYATKLFFFSYIIVESKVSDRATQTKFTASSVVVINLSRRISVPD